jgi:hypothetical protein
MAYPEMFETVAVFFWGLVAIVAVGTRVLGRRRLAKRADRRLLQRQAVKKYQYTSNNTMNASGGNANVHVGRGLGLQESKEG